MKDWEDATEVEKLQAQVTDLYEAVNQLHWLVVEAFAYNETFRDAADFLKEEWGK